MIRCGVLWVGLSRGHRFGPSPPKRLDRSDISIVVLRGFPEHIRLKDVPEWPSPLESSSFPSHLATSGWSATGAVHGSHCTLISDHIVFVESSGEAGNSGTLMYLLYPGKSLPLGIYLGTVPQKKGTNLKVRGRICPFPNQWQDKFLHHDPTPDRDAPDRLQIQTGRRWSNVTLFEKSVTEGNLYYQGPRGDGRDEYGILVGV